MKTKNENFSRDRYLRLSELGSELDLSFSSHLELADKVVGLDGLQKKLLVCDFKNTQGAHQIITLDKVISISVKKKYSGIKPGELKKKRFEEFIESIHLKFDYRDEDDAIILPFYEKGIDDVADLKRLESKARNWQLVLSKMIGINKKGPIEEARSQEIKIFQKVRFM
jgi:hypothetical protein